MKELDRAIDNLKYWAETNEDHGVCTMPEFICNDLLEAYKKYKQQLKENQPKKGEWVVDEYDIHHCPFCEAVNVTIYRNFCSNCGADMRKDGEQHGE